MRFLFLVLSCVSALAAEVSVGLRAGGRATGAFASSYDYREESKRYLLGPSLMVAMPRRFAFEADALYSRTGLATGNCFFSSCSVSSTRGNVWTLPLLLRYHLSSGSVRPYVVAGYSIRVVPDAGVEAQSWRSGPMVPDEQVDYTVQRFHYSEPGRTSHGAAAGGGIVFSLGTVSLLPEVRYTRWNSSYWEQSGSRGSYRASQKNQVDVMMGVSFSIR